MRPNNITSRRRIISGMFACMLLMGLIGFIPSAAAQDASGQLFCTPKDGVQNVENLDDLKSCRVAAQDATPAAGEIVVVVGDQPVGGPVKREIVARYSWMNGIVEGAMPSAPVPQDQLYVAHGDVAGTGTCGAVMWEPGETVEIASQGTWSLWALTGGTAEERQQEAEYIREKAEREAPPCPWIEPSDLPGAGS